jgi:CRISPR system Cascade subunit CasD
MSAQTLFLRLEGPMQSWGDQESEFVIRRTAEAPTKSGVFGLLCAALGVSRAEAPGEWLPKLCSLRMGVRIDDPGIRWWDYHTVGAGMQMQTAEGKTKPGAMLTRREYLCDASFLVALQGEESLIKELNSAMKTPRWTLYLGRKCCPPSRPLLEVGPSGVQMDRDATLVEALSSIPWRPRFKGWRPPGNVDFLLDWEATPEQPEAPVDALIWYDVPLTLDPPSHRPRFVIRGTFAVGESGQVVCGKELQSDTLVPPRPRANYRNTEYRKARADRLMDDNQLCVFCKSPATTVQHITYRRAGGGETQEDLRSLCRLCHDAVTMIEYGLGMGMDRINPEEEQWREWIIEKRAEIIKFRSLETRRRKLAAEEVE